MAVSFKTASETYRPIDLRNISKTPQWDLLRGELQQAIRVVGEVLPFRTNQFVLDSLIDWSKVPDDPIFQLVFPQRGMLKDRDFEVVQSALDGGDGATNLASEVARIREALNPHPAGQMTHNVPKLDGRLLPGLQHKYPETVLFFPAPGQTCHAYCTCLLYTSDAADE